jgi:putative DNA primase/helicase
MSPAAFYRLIEARDRPCLLLDEFDAFAAESEDFRGLLDAGFDNTEMSKVWICTGDDYEPTAFSVFTPQAIAGIGNIKDTVADRCIEIALQRKIRSEKVARLRRRNTAPLVELAQKCARWAKDNVADLAQAEPDIPETIHDRAADSWELLVAIADQAGGHWGKRPNDIGRARRAALWISGDGRYSTEEDSIGIQLLHDIRHVLGPNLLNLNPAAKGVRSADLVTWLISMEDRPWLAYSSRHPINQYQLAKLLRPFNVLSKLRKEGGATYRGYRLKALQMAFDRYLPPVEQDPDDPCLGWHTARDTQ